MDTSLENLVVKLIGDSSSYTAMCKGIQSTTQQTLGAVQKQMSNVGRTTMGISNTILGTIQQYGGMITALAGVATVAKGIQLGVTLAKDAEQAQIQFGVMLKDTMKAEEMLKQIDKFAADTPLKTNGIQQAAKTLLQFGVAGENVMPILKAVGNATGGDNERFQRMSLALGQTASAGKLMGQDLLQMINAGFNPLQQMSKDTGKSMAQLRHEMESGGISANKVMLAFENASKAGGMFDGLMEKQSKSIGGLWSTLTDNLEIQLRKTTLLIIDEFGFKDALKALISFTNTAGKTWENWVVGMVRSAKKEFDQLLPVVNAVWEAFVLGAKFIIQSWNMLDKTFRSNLVWITLLYVTVTTLVAVFTAVFGGLPVLIGVAIVAVASIITKFGDVRTILAQVWEYGKVALEYLTPAFKQLGDVAVAAFQFIGDQVYEFYKMMTEAGKTTYSGFIEGVVSVGQSIYDWIVEGLLFAEFTLKNFGLVSAQVMANTNVAWLALTEDIKYLTLTVIPALVASLATDFGGTIKTVFSSFKERIIELGHNLARLYMWWNDEKERNKKGLAPTKAPMWEKIAKPEEEKLKGMLGITDREITQAEKDAREAARIINQEVGDEFEKFKGEKKEKATFEWADPQKMKEITNAAEIGAFNAGLGIGDNLTKGVKHGEKMESVLAGSAQDFDALLKFYRGKSNVMQTQAEEQAKAAAENVKNARAKRNKGDTIVNGERYDKNFVGPLPEQYADFQGPMIDPKLTQTRERNEFMAQLTSEERYAPRMKAIDIRRAERDADKIVAPPDSKPTETIDVQKQMLDRLDQLVNQGKEDTSNITIEPAGLV